MERQSKLTEAQWEAIGKRLLKGESSSALAREFGVSKSTISGRFSERVQNVKDAENQIVAAERALSTLNISEQIAARSLADDLKAISEHLAGAARFGAATEHRLAGIAHNKAAEIERANELNGVPVESGATEGLFKRYFSWQRGLPPTSEERKADSARNENEKNEAPRLLRTFGKVQPSAIKPVHIYKCLDGRAAEGAPAKANKEIALLSAVLEFGRCKGVLETNPCLNIKYNKTTPDARYVTSTELDLVVRVARERGSMYVVAALCLRAAYLTVRRPDEMRKITRQSITEQGVEMPVGKRKKGRAQKFKLIEWSDELRTVMKEALSLQRTTSVYVFGNSEGQPYTTSGRNTNLRRLMEHVKKKAEKEGIEFLRFTLKDMRPAAVTDRVEEGDETITNATGHSSDRMVKQVYDRRKTKVARATE